MIHPITILSLAAAEKDYQSFSYIISITAPDNTVPLFDGSNVLRLFFDDITYVIPGYCPPEKQHIHALIDFAEKIKQKPGPIMAHCHAGVSRSPAIAIVLLNIIEGPGKEKEIYQHIKSNFPNILPNSRILWLADNVLKRDGKIHASATKNQF